MPKPRSLATASLASLLVLAACGGSAPAPEEQDTASAIDAATSRGVSLALACAGCHSAQSEAMVDLDGYGADALREALIQYRSETEGTTVMHRLARGYSDTDIALLAAEFDQQGTAP